MHHEEIGSSTEPFLQWFLDWFPNIPRISLNIHSLIHKKYEKGPLGNSG